MTKISQMLREKFIFSYISISLFYKNFSLENIRTYCFANKDMQK